MKASLLYLIVLASLPCAAESFGDGCGIYVGDQPFYRDQIFFANPDDSVVVMRIAGELVNLTVLSTEPRGRLRELGDVMRRVYAMGATRVEARFEVTRVCPPGQRECDGVGISARFIVRRGDVVQELSGHGVSGC